MILKEVVPFGYTISLFEGKLSILREGEYVEGDVLHYRVIETINATACSKPENYKHVNVSAILSSGLVHDLYVAKRDHDNYTPFLSPSKVLESENAWSHRFRAFHYMIAERMAML